MSNLSKIRFTSVFFTEKKWIKNPILASESKKMSFFEEVMTIFQKIGSEKKMTWDVGHKCPQLGASDSGLLPNSIPPQMGKIILFSRPYGTGILV